MDRNDTDDRFPTIDRRRHERTNWALLVGLALTVGGILLLTSCTSVPHTARLSTGVGYSTVKGTNDAGESLRANGINVGIRGEVAADIVEVPGLSIGLRGDVRGRSVEVDGLGDNGDGTVSLDAGELSAAIPLRYLVPVTDRVRVYGEGAVGYAHDFGTLDIDAPSGLGRSRESANVGGLLVGAGLGVEIGARDNFAIIGLDWQRVLLDDVGDSQLDLDVDDITLSIGWGFKF